MEWAYEMLNGYGKDERVTRLVDRVRIDRRPDRQPRRLQRSAARRPSTSSTTRSTSSCPTRSCRRPSQDPRRTCTSSTRFFEYKRRNCRIDAGPGHASGRLRAAAVPRLRRRPEPQLRRLLGRPGRERHPRVRHLPRRRPVLRARDAERPLARLAPSGHDADHEPHVLQPRPAPAGHRAPRARRRRADLQGARRRDGVEERLRQPVLLRAVRHDRRHRGLDLLRHRRLRLHVRDRAPTHDRAELRRRSTRRTSCTAEAVGRRARTTAAATARRTTWRWRTRPTRPKHSTLDGPRAGRA